MDISESALEGAAERLRAAYPTLRIEPLVADFTANLQTPAGLSDLPKTGFFPGSTIGNFPPGEAIAFLGVDEPISEAALAELASLPQIRHAKALRF